MKIDFIDKYNSIVGTVVSFLTAVFGVFWYVFATYFLLNIIDCITGTLKARKNGTSRSKICKQGIIGKVGNWVLIAVAFLAASVLTKVAKTTLGIDISFLSGIGWLTTCMLWINEVRSILENLIELDVEVPEAFVKGLAVANKLVEETEKTE